MYCNISKTTHYKFRIQGVKKSYIKLSNNEYFILMEIPKIVYNLETKIRPTR